MVVVRRLSVLFAFAVATLAAGSVPAAGGSAAANPLSTRHAHVLPLLNSPARAAHSASSGGAPANETFVDYNGGPVMPSNTDYMVLWSPRGADAYPAGYVDGVAQWFTDLAHDSGGNQNTDSVSAQYRDLTGAFASYSTTFGGVLVDTHRYPASQCPVNSPVTNCITDAQVQVELERFVASRGLTKDLSHEYFLMTPPHVEFCFGTDPAQLFGGCSAGEVPSNLAFFCAYHGNTTISPFLIYANDPYVPGNPGCDDGNHPNGFWDGELSGGLSHEQNESVSDPIPNDAWTNGIGPLQGSEIGDQCGSQMGKVLGTVNGAKFNQVINGRDYWYQEEWSNIGRECLQRLPSTGTLPTATFTVSAGDGLTLNFDASGSSAPGGVALYVWQFNAVANAQTIQMKTPTISYTFPSAGAFSIGLTVIAGNGASSGAGGVVSTGQNGVSTGFTSSTSGQTVSFNASFSTISAQPVLVDLWEFGDGSVGSGLSPTHTYGAPGNYTVTLVQFSGVGSAFPGDGAGPIMQAVVTVP